MRKTKMNARRIMYKNLKRIFNAITLDGDYLDNEIYKSIWTIKSNGNKIIARCDKIFTDKSDIVIEGL